MRRAISLSLAAALCVSAAFTITVSPGDSVVVSGCTTVLTLAGNVVTCASPSPTRTSTRTPTPTPTSTPTSTRTPTVTPSATVVPTFTPTPTTPPTFLPSVLVGLAIIGDSVEDEYAAPENNRGAVNWVEHLALSGVPLGAWGVWGEPRRTGYAFNWARSGATSYGARFEQAPGVVAQINAGVVSHVIIQLGINDLSQLAAAIAGGTVTNGSLDSVASNIVDAARQVASVAPGRVMVAGVQDYIALDIIPNPEWGQVNPTVAARMSSATAYINNRVRANLPPGAVWFDFNAEMGARLATIRTGDTLTLAGTAVNVRARCTLATCGWVPDPYLHPESVLSGLMAQTFADEMRARWGVYVPVLTDSEIIARAN